LPQADALHSSDCYLTLALAMGKVPFSYVQRLLVARSLRQSLLQSLHGRAFSTASSPAPDTQAVLPAKIVKSPHVKAILPVLGTGAYLFIASGFVMTDMLWLRVLLTGGYTGLTAFHALQERPLLIPLRFSALFTLINGIFAAKLITDNFAQLSDVEMDVYLKHFQLVMSKTDAQRLLHQATYVTATEPQVVVKAGEDPNLVLIFEGETDVILDKGVNITQRPGFAGDMSFLTNEVASATVRVRPGSKYFLWERAALQEFLKENKLVARGLEMVIARDLCFKLRATSDQLVIKSHLSLGQSAKVQMQYENAVLNLALCLGISPGAQDSNPEVWQLFLTELQKHRHYHDIPDIVHARVMAKLNYTKFAVRHTQSGVKEQLNVLMPT